MTEAPDSETLTPLPPAPPLPLRLRMAAAMLTGRRRFRRRHEFVPSDRFIVSYPKSGNTWVRFLVTELLVGEREASFEDVQDLVPDIYKSNDRILEKAPRPRVLKSHSFYDPRYRTLVYIVRDPRDVACSYYHHFRKFKWVDERASLDEFVEGWVTGELDDYGSWSENVGSWLGAREGTEGFLVLRYEDLRANGERGLARIAEHFELDADETAVRQAVAHARFERLRRREVQSAEHWRMTKGSDLSKPFFRQGSSGGWRNELSAPAAALIEQSFGPLMRQFGYLEGRVDDPA